MDTSVLSAGAPGRRGRTAGLVRWMEAHSRALFLSTVTAAEISGGIAELKRGGSVSGATGLNEWLELVLHLYGGRVLPFDTPAARLAGEMMDKARAAGHTPGFADIAIAATTASRRLTRNVRHFAPLGAPTANPFDTLPDRSPLRGRSGDRERRFGAAMASRLTVSSRSATTADIVALRCLASITRAAE